MSKASVSNIKDTIIADAKAEAKRLIDEAEVAAREMTIQARKSAQVQLSSWADRQRQMAQGVGDQILGKAQSDAHLRVLATKSALISTAFEQAAKRLEKERTKAQYKSLLKGLIIQAGTQIGGGNLVVLSRKEDKTLISGITGLATAIGKATSVKTKVTMGKTPIKALGGIMVQNEEGSIIVDNRLETLLSLIEEKQRTALAQILFAEEA